MEGVASEKLLRTNHNGILKDSKTATELARILKEHLEIVDRFGRTCEHDSK